MKAIKLMLLCIIIMFFTSETSKSQPNIQCPFGYVQITKYVMVNVGGTICQYRIVLCVLCPAGTGQPQFTIKLASFVPDPINCGFNEYAAKDAICAIIFDPDWISQNIATDCFAGWGPCPNNIRYVYCETPKCWTKVGYWDGPVWRVITYGCEQSQGCYCKVTKKICWDPVEQKFLVEEIPDPENNINCCPETGIPSNPEEDDETPVGCYYLPCSQ